MTKNGLLEHGHHQLLYVPGVIRGVVSFEYVCMWNTEKIRKEVPKAIQMKTKINTKQCIVMQREHLLCQRYLDKHDVYMLSMIHPAPVSVLDKTDRATNMAFTKPACIVEYCKKMGGVDLSDQIGSYFSCLRKTSKWYMKLFFHLLNVSLSVTKYKHLLFDAS